MSLWDSGFFGEVYSGEGCFVVRYEDGRVVQHMGPYSSERKSENARIRWRRNRLNAADRKLIRDGDVDDEQPPTGTFPPQCHSLDPGVYGRAGWASDEDRLA